MRMNISDHHQCCGGGHRWADTDAIQIAPYRRFCRRALPGARIIFGAGVSSPVGARRFRMARTSIDLDALVSRVDELVRAHGAVVRGRLRAIKRHLPAVAPQPVARGLEVGSGIRRPLEAHLLEAARAGFVPRKGLERRVVGNGRDHRTPPVPFPYCPTASRQ
jgi:hypothetical protein